MVKSYKTVTRKYSELFLTCRVFPVLGQSRRVLWQLYRSWSLPLKTLTDEWRLRITRLTSLVTMHDGYFMMTFSDNLFLALAWLFPLNRERHQITHHGTVFRPIVGNPVGCCRPSVSTPAAVSTEKSLCLQWVYVVWLVPAPSACRRLPTLGDWEQQVVWLEPRKDVTASSSLHDSQVQSVLHSYTYKALLNH